MGVIGVSSHPFFVTQLRSLLCASQNLPYKHGVPVADTYGGGVVTLLLREYCSSHACCANTDSQRFPTNMLPCPNAQMSASPDRDASLTSKRPDLAQRSML